jgi:hypothetical protein
MDEQIDRYLMFADAWRSRAARECFPPWREKMLSLAELTERQATLVARSRESIDESKVLIARAEILLRRHQ